MTTNPALDGTVLAVDDMHQIGRWEPDGRELEYARETMARSLSEIPARYSDARVTNPGVERWLRSLVQIARDTPAIRPSISSGPSLLLIGGTGSGKTFEAFGAIRALAVTGAVFRWTAITAADLYAKLRPRARVDTEEVFEGFLRGVLILDDLGAAKGSEWNEEINYRLINHRYEHNLPTLITSNVPPKDLASVLGERVASRLVEMADRVVIKGADRRLTPKAGAA